MRLVTMVVARLRGDVGHDEALALLDALTPFAPPCEFRLLRTRQNYSARHLEWGFDGRPSGIEDFVTHLRGEARVVADGVSVSATDLDPAQEPATARASHVGRPARPPDRAARP